MSHRRAQIREAAQVLLGGIPSGPPVTQGMVYPWATVGLPSIDVTTPSEDMVQPSMGGPSYVQSRNLVLRVECRAEGDTYLSTLDQMALEVEQAMMVDTSLGGLVASVRIERTETEADNQVETPIGVLRMDFAAMYSVSGTDPQ